MRILPILVPYAGDVARWGAARGPAAIWESSLTDALRQHGHAVAAPVEIVFPRERRTRDPITNLGSSPPWCPTRWRRRSRRGNCRWCWNATAPRRSGPPAI